MRIDTVFAVVNWGIVVPWLLLALAPTAKVTRVMVHSLVPCFVLTPIYAFLLFADRPGPQGANFFSLEGVTHIFSTPWTIVACWFHYLVFDLFVGAWEVRDARRLGIRHLYVIPSLALTLMFGPIGLFSWGIVRAIAKRRVSTDETGIPEIAAS